MLFLLIFGLFLTFFWYFTCTNGRNGLSLCHKITTQMSNTWHPSASEEREAADYLKLRISCVDSYLAHCTEYVREAIRRIVAICYRYREPVSVRSFSFSQNPLMRQEIEEVVKWLISQLENSVDDLLELAVEDDNTELLLWLDTRNPDYSVRQGFEFYEGQWEDEVEAQVTGNLYLGSSEDECAYNILGSMEHPYDSDWWKAAVAMAGIDTMSSILRNGGVSYGVGRTNVGINMLRFFGQQQIEAGFHHTWWTERHRDAREFRVVTQKDGRVCDDCYDEEQRGWQPMENYEPCNYGRWGHRNCRCYTYFR